MTLKIDSKYECPVCFKSMESLAEEQHKQNLPLIVAIFSGTIQKLYYDAPDFLKLQKLKFHKITDKEESLSFYLKYNKEGSSTTEYDLTHLPKEALSCAVEACYDPRPISRLVAQYQFYSHFTPRRCEKEYWLTLIKHSATTLLPTQTPIVKFSPSQLTALKSISELVGNCSVLDVTISVALADSSPSEQLSYLKKASKSEPQSLLIQLHLGVYRLKSKDFYLACAYFEIVLKSDKKNKIALEGIGTAYFHRQEYTLAAQHLETLLEIDSTHFAALILLGHIYLDKNLNTLSGTTKALDYFRKANQINSQEASYHLALYYIELASRIKTSDLTVQVEKYLILYLQLNDTSDTAFTRVAEIYFDKKVNFPENISKAYMYAIRALALNPSNLKAKQIFDSLKPNNPVSNHILTQITPKKMQSNSKRLNSQLQNNTEKPKKPKNESSQEASLKLNSIFNNNPPPTTSLIDIKSDVESLL